MKRQRLVNEVNAYNNVFCEGVYVDGISLGGMTPEEGYCRSAGPGAGAEQLLGR